MSTYGCVIVSAALAVLVGVSASAHHSASYFDLSSDVTHSDVTVVSYHLVNPHGRLVYSFTDEVGHAVEWTAELPGANYLRRLGMELALHPGDSLTSVTGSPSKSGLRYMLLDRVVFENGEVARTRDWRFRFVDGATRPD